MLSRFGKSLLSQRTLTSNLPNSARACGLRSCTKQHSFTNHDSHLDSHNETDVYKAIRSSSPVQGGRGSTESHLLSSHTGNVRIDFHRELMACLVQRKSRAIGSEPCLDYEESLITSTVSTLSAVPTSVALRTLVEGVRRGESQSLPQSNDEEAIRLVCSLLHSLHNSTSAADIDMMEDYVYLCRSLVCMLESVAGASGMLGMLAEGDLGRLMGVIRNDERLWALLQGILPKGSSALLELELICRNCVTYANALEPHSKSSWRSLASGSVSGEDYFERLYYYFTLTTNAAALQPTHAGSEEIQSGLHLQEHLGQVTKSAMFFMTHLYEKYPDMEKLWIKAWNEKTREAAFRRVFCFVESVCRSLSPSLPSESTVSQTVQVSARVAALCAAYPEAMKSEVSKHENGWLNESFSPMNSLKTSCFIRIFCGDHVSVDIVEETRVLADMYASMSEKNGYKEKAVELLILSHVFNIEEPVRMFISEVKSASKSSTLSHSLARDGALIVERCRFLEKVFTSSIARRLSDISTTRDVIRQDIDFDNSNLVTKAGIANELDFRMQEAVDRLKCGIERDGLVLSKLASLRREVNDYSGPGIEEYGAFARNAIQSL